MIDGLLVDEVNFIGRRASDGLRLVSVTAPIKHAGFIPDMRYVPEHALVRGQVVHADIRLMLKGTIDWSTVHPESEPRVRAVERFLKDTGATTLYSEQPVWHPGLCYWGILDWAGILNGRLAVIDFKNGPVQDWVRYQTAGYAGALRDMKLGGVPRRFGLELKPDSTYKLSDEFKNPNDFHCFDAMVALMWEKLNRGYIKQREAQDGNIADGGQDGSGEVGVGRDGGDDRSARPYVGFEGFGVS